MSQIEILAGNIAELKRNLMILGSIVKDLRSEVNMLKGSAQQQTSAAVDSAIEELKKEITRERVMMEASLDHKITQQASRVVSDVSADSVSVSIAPSDPVPPGVAV